MSFLDKDGLTYTLQKLKPIIDKKANKNDVYTKEEMNKILYEGKAIMNSIVSESISVDIERPDPTVGVSKFIEIGDIELDNEHPKVSGIIKRVNGLKSSLTNYKFAPYYLNIVNFTIWRVDRIDGCAFDGTRYDYDMMGYYEYCGTGIPNYANSEFIIVPVSENTVKLCTGSQCVQYEMIGDFKSQFTPRNGDISFISRPHYTNNMVLNSRNIYRGGIL